VTELARRSRGDGCDLGVTLRMFNTTITVVNDAKLAVYDQWGFETPEKALAALAAWDGAKGTEPMGWFRHPSTGRRRPGGDASKEFIHY